MKLTPNPEFLKAPAEHRKKWHDALVNAKHEQGKRHLVDADGGYCCLGIGHEAFGGQPRFLKREAKYCPPDRGAFARSLGSRNPNLGIDEDGRLYCAVKCNDICELTFPQIAQLIYPENYGKVEIAI